ncbi:MAG: IPTL-CTERM sorting domain-containing protein [Chitinophagales bacterium]
MRISTTNDYGEASRSLVFSSGFAVSSFDLDFEIITQDITPPPPPVPTLSEWGLIVLALLLMTLGTLYLLQPNWRGRSEE